MIQKEHVILVDEQDTALGTEEKIRAHELGLLHRAFSVFVYRKRNNTIEFLLQQRHPDKYHCGDLWTNTCCSHPRWNEEIVFAGERRLKEEMNLELPLVKIGSFLYRSEFANGLIEHEYDHVLIGEYQAGMNIAVDPNEVKNYAWVSLASLEKDILDKDMLDRDMLDKDMLDKDMLQAENHHFTPWFKPALKIALEGLCINS